VPVFIFRFDRLYHCAADRLHPAYVRDGVDFGMPVRSLVGKIHQGERGEGLDGFRLERWRTL